MEKTQQGGKRARAREKEEDEVKQAVLAFHSCFQRAHRRIRTMELFATQSFSLEGLAC